VSKTSTTSNRKQAGRITYDDRFGHVCTCTERGVYFDRDGTPYVEYSNTVAADRSIAPTESGSWWYSCSRCGAGAWSGC
jgi:hypothetical protein